MTKADADKPLSSVVQELRAIPGGEWGENALDELRIIRHGGLLSPVPRIREVAMSNLGEVDGRQDGDMLRRFRPQYRTLTDDEKALHDEIKTKAEELAVLFEKVRPGRYRSLSLTALEEAVMWNIKELTS